MWKKTLLILSALIVVSFLYIDVSGDNFREKIKGEVHQILDGASQERAGKVDYGKLGQLPEPVRRYFSNALKDGQEYIEKVALKQTGEFRAKEVNRWIPFEAEQYFTTEGPSYVWHGRLKSSPYVWIEARDVYFKGTGAMTSRLFSALPLSTAAGKEADLSSLARFLAEAVWYPTALLPGGRVEWRAVDSNSAQAEIRDYGYSVSAVFSFDGRGDVTKVTTKDRYRSIDGRYETGLWTAHYGDYREIHGMRIPTEAELEWNLHDRNFRYAKMKITEIRYDGELSGL